MFLLESCDRDLLLLSLSSSESPLLGITIGSETFGTVLRLDSPLTGRVEAVVVEVVDLALVLCGWSRRDSASVVVVVVGAADPSPVLGGWWRRDSASLLRFWADDTASDRMSGRTGALCTFLTVDDNFCCISFWRNRRARSDSIFIAIRLASSLEYPVISRLLIVSATL